MKCSDFINSLIDIAENYNTVYMWGVFGAPVTEGLISAKAAQYKDWYTAARVKSFRELIGKGYFGFDCVNVIKGVLWGWSGDASKSFGGAKYTAAGVPDINADQAIGICSDVSTDFSRLKVGAALWCKGHIGIYIGGGRAIECTTLWENKVQITAVGNIGRIAGLHTRTWTKHGLLPWIDYSDGAESKEIEEGDDMVRYEKVNDIPESSHFREIVDDLMTAGIIGGDGSDPKGNNDVIDLSHDMVRMLIFEYRAGVYDAALTAAGIDPGKYK